MRFFVSADEIGNIKEVVCTRGTDTSKKDGQQPEQVQNLLQKDELTAVKTRIVGLKTFEEKWIIASRRGGYLNVYELFGSSEIAEENYKLLHTYKFDVEPKDVPVSLEISEEKDLAFVAFESGKLFIVYFNGGKFNVAPKMLELPPRQTEKPSTVNAFVANPYVAGIFAYGGKDNDLQIIRLFDAAATFSEPEFASSFKLKTLFKADNVEPDHLDLEVPIWITKILFFKGDSKKKFRLVTATNYGHIRKYDTAEDKEPTDSYKVCDRAIVSLVFGSQAQDNIIITDTHTFVAKMSLTQVDKKAHKIISASAGTFWKPSLKLLGKYSEGGNTGAVYGVDTSLGAGLVAFGGLDRYLRVFDIDSRKLVSKVYLGTQISAIKLLEGSDGNEEEENEEEAENDEFWNELDEGKEAESEAPVLKKRKRNI
ncbi:hypothetical protein OXX79_005470 [Metschnikowia pulcherrima]